MQDHFSQGRVVKLPASALRGRVLAVLLIASAVPLGAAFGQQPAPPPATNPAPPPPAAAAPPPAPAPAASEPAAEPDDAANAPRSRRDREQARRDRIEQRNERERERRYTRDWQRSMGPFALAPLCGPGFGRRIDNDLRRIARAVVPTDAQRGAFDDLRTAAATARDQAQEGCNEAPAQTPTARLQLMDERLSSVQQAVRTLRPPLDTFYASLSDEQKARFNELNLTMTSGADTPRERRRGRHHRYYHRHWGWPFFW
jgi:type IV secretory pathway VirB10-like protein